MKKGIILIVCILMSFYVGAQEALYEFEKKVYVSSSGDTLRYRLLLPENYDKNKIYPLVLFLHGAGERGSDNEKQLAHGGQMWLNPVNREKYPAFVLAPQCPEDSYWAYGSRPKSFVPDEMPLNTQDVHITKLLKELLDSYISLEQTDNDRIYIMGLSMGGMGTFDMVARYPDVFAAAVPICGIINPSRLSGVKDVKFRIFHGDADNVVPVNGSRSAYKALRNAGASVEYIEIPGCNHGSWYPAFSYPDFMQWLFKQKKD